MIVKCPRCTRSFDDEFRFTFCPHTTFIANDGQNNFREYPESYLGPPERSTLMNTQTTIHAFNSIQSGCSKCGNGTVVPAIREAVAAAMPAGIPMLGLTHQLGGPMQAVTVRYCPGGKELTEISGLGIPPKKNTIIYLTSSLNESGLAVTI